MVSRKTTTASLHDKKVHFVKCFTFYISMWRQNDMAGGWSPSYSAFWATGFTITYTIRCHLGSKFHSIVNTESCFHKVQGFLVESRPIYSHFWSRFYKNQVFICIGEQHLFGDDEITLYLYPTFPLACGARALSTLIT